MGNLRLSPTPRTREGVQTETSPAEGGLDDLRLVTSSESECVQFSGATNEQFSPGVDRVPVSDGLTLNLTYLWSLLLICRSSPAGHSYGSQLTGWAVTQ